MGTLLLNTLSEVTVTLLKYVIRSTIIPLSSFICIIKRQLRAGMNSTLVCVLLLNTGPNADAPTWLKCLASNRHEGVAHNGQAGQDSGNDAHLQSRAVNLHSVNSHTRGHGTLWLRSSAVS